MCSKQRSRAVYAKKQRDSVSTQNMTQTITEHTLVCERGACIVCEEHYISLNLKGAFEMRHSFLYFFVGTNFCTQVLAHLRRLYASPQKLAWPLRKSFLLVQLLVPTHKVRTSLPQKVNEIFLLPSFACLDDWFVNPLTSSGSLRPPWGGN